MFVIGFKLPKPIINEVIPRSIAGLAGLHADEEIIKVDKYTTNNWGEVIIAMLSRIGDEGNLKVVTSSTSKSKTNDYQLDLKNWALDSYNPDILLSVGLVPYKPKILPIVYRVAKMSPAAKAGLQKGDFIIGIDGNKIGDWQDFIQKIKSYPHKKISLLLNRDGKDLNLNVTTSWRLERGLKRIGFLGVTVDTDKIVWPKHLVREYKYKPWSAFPAIMHQMKSFLDLNNIVLSKLLVGKISLSVLGGPIATFTASGKALSQGFVMFMGFLATISLTIALVNLLPLPGLDGGHLILILIEAIRRRPISMRTQLLVFRLGIALFVLLVIQTTANDLIRILG